MKIAVTTPKPRNPLVVLARFRQAGDHRMRAGGQRQQARHALRRELDRMKHSP